MNGSWAESPGVGSEVEKKQKVLNILEVKDLDGNRDQVNLDARGTRCKARTEE